MQEKYFYRVALALCVLCTLWSGCAGRSTDSLPRLTPDVPLGVPAPRVSVEAPPLPSVTRVDLEAPPRGLNLLNDLFPENEQFSLNVQGAPLADVLAVFSERSSKPLVLDPEIDLKISATFREVALTEAATSLFVRLDLGVRAEGGMIRVGRVPLATSAFHLSLPDALLVSGGDDLATAGLESWSTIKEMLDLVLSDRGEIRLDPPGSLLVIRDLPRNIGLAEQVLQQFVGPRRRQVMIEALVVEVSLSDEFKYGIDWSAMGMDFKVGSNRVVGTAETNLAPLFPSATFTIDSSNLDALLNLLGTRGQLNVLSAPRITTLNRVAAKINVTEEVPYYTSEFAGLGIEVVQNIEIAFRQAGIELEVVPSVSVEGDIILALHPVITEVTGFTESIENLPPNPILDTREVRTIVRARTGESVVLGGLIRRRYNEQMKYVPGLGSVPYLGSAFRGVEQEALRSELVLIITPVVFEHATHRAALEGSLERTESLRREYAPGPIPKAQTDEARTEADRRKR